MDEIKKEPVDIAQAEPALAAGKQDEHVQAAVTIIVDKDGKVKIMSTPNMSELEVVGLISKAATTVALVQPKREPLIQRVAGSLPFSAFRGGAHGKGKR